MKKIMNGKQQTIGEYLMSEINFEKMQNLIGQKFFELLKNKLYPLVTNKDQYLVLVQDGESKNILRKIDKSDEYHKRIICCYITKDENLSNFKFNHQNDVVVYIHFVISNNVLEFDLKKHDICDYELICPIQEEPFRDYMRGFDSAIRCFCEGKQWKPLIEIINFRKQKCSLEEIYNMITEEEKNIILD